MASIATKHVQKSPENPLPQSDDDRAVTMADDDRLADWKEEFTADREESAKWRSLAREWKSFEAGRQWANEDMVYLREQQRPAVTINLTRPVITMVRGQELQAREDIVAFGREEGDARVSEIATAGLDYVRDNCDASFQWSEAFGSMLVTGMGWIGSRIDYDDNSSGELVDDHLDELSMYVDYASRRRNCSDARRIWQVKILDLKAAQHLAGGDYDVGELDAAWTQVDLPGMTSRETRAQRDYKGQRSGGRPSVRQVRLVERQWWEMGTFYLVTDPRDGAELELSEAELAEYGVHGMVTGTVQRKVWKKALIGSRILYEEELGTRDFHFQCMTGVRDEIEGYWCGLVPSMMDAQRWVNKWLTQTIHIYNTSGKGGLEYETGAFADPDRAIRDWPKSSAAIEYMDGALVGGKAREKAVGQLPPGFEQMIPLLIDMVRQSAGVNPELLGMTPGTSPVDPSGVLEMQRQRAGLTMLAEYFDSMKLFLRMHGRLHLGMIRSFMNDKRLVRIVGETGAQYVPLFLESDADDYDLITEGVPTSPNNRERNWRFMTPLIPILMQNPATPPELMVEMLKLSPLPPQFAEKAGEALQRAQQPDPEEEARRKQEEELRIRGIVASILKDEAAAKKSEAAAVLDMAKAEATGEEIRLKALDGVIQGAETMKRVPLDPNRVMDVQSREREGEAGRRASIYQAGLAKSLGAERRAN